MMKGICSMSYKHSVSIFYLHGTKSDVWKGKYTVNQFLPIQYYHFFLPLTTKRKGIFSFLLKGDSIILPIWQILQYVECATSAKILLLSPFLFPSRVSNNVYKFRNHHKYTKVPIEILQVLLSYL